MGPRPAVRISEASPASRAQPDPFTVLPGLFSVAQFSARRGVAGHPGYGGGAPSRCGDDRLEPGDHRDRIRAGVPAGLQHRALHGPVRPGHAGAFRSAAAQRGRRAGDQRVAVGDHGRRRASHARIEAITTAAAAHRNHGAVCSSKHTAAPCERVEPPGRDDGPRAEKAVGGPSEIASDQRDDQDGDDADQNRAAGLWPGQAFGDYEAQSGGMMWSLPGDELVEIREHARQRRPRLPTHPPPRPSPAPAALRASDAPPPPARVPGRGGRRPDAIGVIPRTPRGSGARPGPGRTRRRPRR